jgi:hypothetical protein
MALQSSCAEVLETPPQPPFNMTEFYHIAEQMYGLDNDSSV